MDTQSQDNPSTGETNLDQSSDADTIHPSEITLQRPIIPITFPNGFPVPAEPAPEPPAPEQPTAEQYTTEQSIPEQSTPEQSRAEQPTSEQSREQLRAEQPTSLQVLCETNRNIILGNISMCFKFSTDNSQLAKIYYSLESLTADIRQWHRLRHLDISRQNISILNHLALSFPLLETLNV